MRENFRPWSLLRPGADGWELWKFRPGGPPSCQQAPSASAVSSAPRLTAALPTRDLAAIPLWLPASGNLRELAELELSSRNLLRRGMEVQCLPIETGETRSLVLAVASGEIENATTVFRAAGRFEANARTWLPAGADVVLWKESGVLCFAIFRGDHCVFFSTGGPLGPGLCGAIKRTLLRLRAEEVLVREPRLVRLYGEFPESERKVLESGLGIPLEYSSEPPFPFLPANAADLPPPAIRELRSTRQRRARFAGIGLSVLAVYAVLVLAVGGELLSKHWQARALRAEADSLATAAGSAREEITRWREIRHAVDPGVFALDLVAAVAAQLPGDQVRLTLFSLEPGRLSLAGEARDVSQAYAFIEKTKSAPALSEFDWTSSQPELAGKQNVRFTMEGSQPHAQTLNE